MIEEREVCKNEQSSLKNKMAPHPVETELFAFPNKTGYSQFMRSVDEGEKTRKTNINRQISSNFPEEQDNKEIPSLEEWKRSLALLSPAVLQLFQAQMLNNVHPVEHPTSPVAKKEKEVDFWPGQTPGLEQNVTKSKLAIGRKRAVEHDHDVIYTSELNTNDGQKAIEKQLYIDKQTKSIGETEEKCSITCTEDSDPDELLLVTLPPHPSPAADDRVFEQNNTIYVPDVVVEQQQVTDATAKLTKEKILPRRSPRRHAAGKVKRNQYYVTEASPPPAKKRKKEKEKPRAKKVKGKSQENKVVLNNEANEEYQVLLAEQQTNRVKEIMKKSSGRQNYGIKQKQNRRIDQKVRKENKNLPQPTVAEVDHCLSELKELVKQAEMFKFWTPVANKVTAGNYHYTRKKSNDNIHGVTDAEAVDSGVGSGSSGSLDGNSANSSSGGGNAPDGGGGNIGGGGDRSNGQGDNDDDDDDDSSKKRQPWEMEEEIDNTEEEKMETDEEELSSENVPNCKEAVGVELKVPEGAVGVGATNVQGREQEIIGIQPFEAPTYAAQDVRHAAYCTQRGCTNQNCMKVKAEFEHLTSHKNYHSCERCSGCYMVITDHSKTCPLPGCRVPFCADLKKKSKNTKVRQAPQTVMQPPALQPYQNIGIYGPPPLGFPIQPFGQYSTCPKRQSVLDGQVLLQNSDLLPPKGRFFQEHIDYHVQKQKLLGKGTNGNVYQVLAKTSSLESKQMAMKVTNYPIGGEELGVYKTLGTDHENIVATHGVTYKGTEGCACIFMEKCDKSLWHLLSEVPTHLLNVEDAMHYVCQVLEAIDYMHSKRVIHRDIKAKNVMLSQEEDFVRAKLGDMDSAKLLEDEFTKKGLSPVGTPGFAAQEVRRKEPHGRPADIYSTGCFILELTVGVPSGDTLHQKIEMLKQKDPELASIVAECVNEDFTLRPTAKDLLAHPRIAKYKMARTVPLEV